MHIVFLDQDTAGCCSGAVHRAGNISDQALKGALHNEGSCCEKSKTVCGSASHDLWYQEGASAGVSRAAHKQQAA